MSHYQVTDHERSIERQPDLDSAQQDAFQAGKYGLVSRCHSELLVGLMCRRDCCLIKTEFSNDRAMIGRAAITAHIGVMSRKVVVVPDVINAQQ